MPAYKVHCHSPTRLMGGNVKPAAASRVSADKISAAAHRQCFRAACAHRKATQALLGWRVVVQLCQAEAWHLQVMGTLASELESSHLHVTIIWNYKPCNILVPVVSLHLTPGVQHSRATQTNMGLSLRQPPHQAVHQVERS